MRWKRYCSLDRAPTRRRSAHWNLKRSQTRRGASQRGYSCRTCRVPNMNCVDRLPVHGRKAGEWGSGIDRWRNLKHAQPACPLCLQCRRQHAPPQSYSHHLLRHQLPKLSNLGAFHGLIKQFGLSILATLDKLKRCWPVLPIRQSAQSIFHCSKFWTNCDQRRQPPFFGFANTNFVRCWPHKSTCKFRVTSRRQSRTGSCFGRAVRTSTQYWSPFRSYPQLGPTTSKQPLWAFW